MTVGKMISGDFTTSTFHIVVADTGTRFRCAVFGYNRFPGRRIQSDRPTQEEAAS